MFPLYAATVTHRRWQWSVKFALEATVASGGWYTWSFTYLHRQKLYGVRSGDLQGQEMVSAHPSQAFCTSDVIFL
jgi:hypothetical protein